MKSISRKGIVAKIQLGTMLEELNTEYGFCSNENDAFVLNKAVVEKYSVNFRAPKEENASVFMPGVGSKFYGNYRDKGSISSIPDANVVVVYDFKTVVETNRFEEFVKQITNPYKRVGKKLLVAVDMVANPSTGRDNVNALLVDSALTYKSILKDVDVKLTYEEVANIDMRELVKEINMDYEVILVDDDWDEIYSFGKTCVLLEDIFWQPTHDQKIHNKIKSNISLNYNQAIDGIQVMLPTLYKSIINSYDTKKISEVMDMLGINLSSNEDIVHKHVSYGSKTPTINTCDELLEEFL